MLLIYKPLLPSQIVLFFLASDVFIVKSFPSYGNNVILFTKLLSCYKWKVYILIFLFVFICFAYPSRPYCALI
jgi:hypothetical protein